MEWKYCEGRRKVYWKASGLINGYRVVLVVEDDFDYGRPSWKVESSQYGTFFSKPVFIFNPSLTQAKEQAETLFYKMKKQYEGKDEFD